MPRLIIVALHSIAVLAILGGGLYLAFSYLQQHFTSSDKGQEAQKFRRQIWQVVAVLVSILFAILLLPLGEMRSDLLQLYGLVLSATIALSSTTLVGNALAGIMLRTIRTCKPGDHITVGNHFGRISEMDLLHTEIQNEIGGDLTTLPNLYLVTHPVRVMRDPGTILSVELSLGYDAPRREIERLLVEAAVATGLDQPFVEIRNLGDFSVTYSVSGVLNDVGSLLKKRRELRARVMDTLHGAGVEIVSPTFMNTRSYSPDRAFISEVSAGVDEALENSPDALIFDKATQARSIEELREKLLSQECKLQECNELIANSGKEQVTEAAARKRDSIQAGVDRLRSLIEAKEAKLNDG
jgi:small-conductance mechanosensitive channel